jgi:MFS family permease
MGLLELAAAIVSAVLGWRSGRIGEREVKAIAIIVLGWTAVTTVASLPYVSLTSLMAVLIYRALLIGAPYTIAAVAKRLQHRRR